MSSFSDIGVAALVVVDMQNGYCKPDGFVAKLGSDYRRCASIIEPIGRLLEATRLAGLAVFFTRYCLKPDYSNAGLILDLFPEIRSVGGMVENTWDTAIVRELEPRPGETVIDKTRYSAFVGTPLESELRARDVTRLIVCGVTANVCVEGTVRDAFSRDFPVLVPVDATAALTDEFYEAAITSFRYGFAELTTVAELERALTAVTSKGA